MNILKDSFGRTFPYIRMSITDVCNFKCGYCLPNGYQVDKSDNRKFLLFKFNFCLVFFIYASKLTSIVQCKDTLPKKIKLKNKKRKIFSISSFAILSCIKR